MPVLGAGLKKGHIKKSDRKVPEQYIVVFEDRVAAQDVDALADELVYQHRGRKKHVYGKALKGFAAVLSEKEALKLSQHPSVKYVEEDGYVEATATQTGATWGLDRIDQ
ncbi:MAG TPA: protease inhibitor I9 family protein, partial [Thermoanaerobaculia bacterium]|nr:protease inhibitor I9 family protein [Thermoanaerobaculia bacterium]